MRIPLAWHNTLQNKKRSLAAVAGIAFSLLLIFMQLGFLNTAKTNSTIVYNYFVYDLIITSNQFESLDSAHFFDRARLLQSRVVPGVARIAPLNTSSHRWRDPDPTRHGHGGHVLSSRLRTNGGGARGFTALATGHDQRLV